MCTGAGRNLSHTHTHTRGTTKIAKSYCWIDGFFSHVLGPVKIPVQLRTIRSTQNYSRLKYSFLLVSSGMKKAAFLLVVGIKSFFFSVPLLCANAYGLARASSSRRFFRLWHTDRLPWLLHFLNAIFGSVHAATQPFINLPNIVDAIQPFFPLHTSGRMEVCVCVCVFAWLGMNTCIIQCVESRKFMCVSLDKTKRTNARIKLVHAAHIIQLYCSMVVCSPFFSFFSQTTTHNNKIQTKWNKIDIYRGQQNPTELALIQITSACISFTLFLYFSFSLPALWFLKSVNPISLHRPICFASFFTCFWTNDGTHETGCSQRGLAHANKQI